MKIFKEMISKHFGHVSRFLKPGISSIFNTLPRAKCSKKERKEDNTPSIKKKKLGMKCEKGIE